MKRIISIILTLVMAACFFAGCKKDAPKTETTPNSTTGTTSDSEPKMPKFGNTPENTTTNEELAELKVYPSDTETLRVAISTATNDMCLFGLADSPNADPLNVFYDGLLVWDSVNNAVAPRLATEWEWIDGTTLQLKLREDITSIMGDPFTASDVVFTITTQCANAKVSSYFGVIDLAKTKAVDDYTVQIGVSSPYPFLVNDLVTGVWWMLCEASVQKLGGVEACRSNPSGGTGAYKLNEWDPTQKFIAERRDDYWGQMPYYKYIECAYVADSTTRCFGIEAGDYQYAEKISAAQAVASKDSPDVKVWGISAPGSASSLYINSDHEPLNILECRQAIALAIDYKAMGEIIFHGYNVVPDACFFTPLHDYYTPVTDMEKNCIRHDPELAKQKLIAAGYPDGFTVKCLFASQTGTAMAEALQNMLSQVGITLIPEPAEPAIVSSTTRSGSYELSLGQGSNPSPSRILGVADPRVGFAGANGYCGDSWYGDNDIESLLDKCRYTVDDAARTAALTELNDLTRELVPKVLVSAHMALALTSPEIKAMKTSSSGIVYLWSLYSDEYLTGK